MKAKIDIKTPSGQSLEGFPLEETLLVAKDEHPFYELSDVFRQSQFPKWILKQGDIITIQIL